MDLALLLLYVAITLVGLFPFHGIPVLNVALGFPIGAAIANRGMRRRARPASTATLTGDPPDDPVLARAGDPPDDPVLAGAGNPPDDPVLAGAGDPPGGPGTDPRHVMRSVLYGSFATAGVTLLVCWIQLVLTILLLRIVGLGERYDHKPTELSGGQQQRVAIARAFANDPAIILADEPTGNLDLRTGKEIITLLKNMNEDKNVTVISATHDLKMIDVSDRVLWIRDGKIDRVQERADIELQVGQMEGE